MKKKLLIIGASGHGKVVADIALKMDKWSELSFLDDNLVGSIMGINIIGISQDAFDLLKEYEVFVGIGNNEIREKFHRDLFAQGASIPVLIHPSVTIGENVNIECGTVVMAGAVINCCTNIGMGCIINTAATIDHDSHLSDFVHISPGSHLAGAVEVGKQTWLGIGSIVSNNIKIADKCTVGAGAVVIRDIIEAGTYIGVPARRV